MAVPIPNLNFNTATDSEANAGGFGNERSHTWNFAPPQYQVKAMQQQQAATQWQSVAFLGAAVGLAWLVLRK